MTDPKPDKPDSTTANLLEMRQFAIGLTIATERMLENLGHPVESAVVTRRERRNLTRRPKKK